MKKLRIKFAACAAAFAFVTPAHADEPIELPLVKDIPASTGYEGRIPDVLGIHFGDTYADVLARLKEVYPNVQIRERTEAPGIADNNGNQVFFNYKVEIGAYAEGNPSDEFVVRFTSAATGERVYYIKRVVSYSDDKLGSMKDLRASMADKYGEPTLTELFPHQGEDEITYTWEKRPVVPLGTHDLSKEPSGSYDNMCLGTATLSGYGLTSEIYSFMAPGARKGNPGYDVCIGGLKFVIFYGKNNETVSSIRIEGTDYDRSMVDARTVDETLARLLKEKAGAVIGDGAPKL